MAQRFDFGSISNEVIRHIFMLPHFKSNTEQLEDVAIRLLILLQPSTGEFEQDERVRDETLFASISYGFWIFGISAFGSLG
jgi:hypothetical protein